MSLEKLDAARCSVDVKCTEKGEMSLEKLNAARCSVEVKCTEEGEMSLEDLDAARCSVDEKEGYPIRCALAIDEQQRSALALERAFPFWRPHSFSANRAPCAGPSVYRVGSPLLPRARWQVVRGCK